VSITAVVAGVDRETRIADLEIHGWRPVKNTSTGRCGIYHEGVGVGFSVRNGSVLTSDSGVKRIDRDHAANSYVDCPWDEVTDWHLDRIDARLAEV
jgi:hypothetical protein